MSLEEDLRALRDDAPPAGGDLVGGVMRQLATRPLPRRSWWQRLTAERELTFRVRPARLAVGACAIAGLLLVVTRPRPQPQSSLASTSASVLGDAPVRVRFTLSSPQARTVALAGDFNGWRPDANLLQRRGDGSWSIEVPLSRGNWSYSFVVDGKWVEDPAADSWRDDGFGGRNAIVRVGEAPAALGKQRGG